MAINLHPFPEYRLTTAGPVVDRLPVTRDGVRLVAEGALRTVAGPVYAEIKIRTKATGATSRGICGLLPAAAFLDGRVKFHERTLHTRLARQEQTVLADEGALGKPVLLTVPRLRGLWEQLTDQPAAAPQLTFLGANNDYQLWPRTHPTPTIPLPVTGPLVIADGHHRAETHARLSAAGERCCDFIPVCIIGGDELTIGTFTRVIDDERLPGDLLPQLASFFHYEAVPHPTAPTRPGEWLLSIGHHCYRLIRRDHGETIDSEWLDGTVLPVVFGIADTRTAANISFAPADAPENGRADLTPQTGKVQFQGYPLPVEDFFTEVAAGHCLPAKSTRFEPRVPSGLVIWQPQVAD